MENQQLFALLTGLVVGSIINCYNKNKEFEVYKQKLTRDIDRAKLINSLYLR